MSKAFARLAVSCVAAVIAATLSAQETTGSLSGNVTDASNAPLPGVTVEISGPALQGTRLAITTPEGRYRFLNLPPGDSTRSFQSLSVMTPGVSLEMADAQPGRRGLFATSPAVGSGTPPENNYIIEGMSTRYTLNGLSGTSLTMNFVQELQVLTGGYSAEWGRSTGGILNVVTKSGSNELHGGDEGVAEAVCCDRPGEQIQPGESGICTVANPWRDCSRHSRNAVRRAIDLQHEEVGIEDEPSPVLVHRQTRRVNGDRGRGDVVRLQADRCVIFSITGDDLRGAFTRDLQYAPLVGDKQISGAVERRRPRCVKITGNRREEPRLRIDPAG